MATDYCVLAKLSKGVEVFSKTRPEAVCAPLWKDARTLKEYPLRKDVLLSAASEGRRPPVSPLYICKANSTVPYPPPLSLCDGKQCTAGISEKAVHRQSLIIHRPHLQPSAMRKLYHTRRTQSVPVSWSQGSAFHEPVVAIPRSLGLLRLRYPFWPFPAVQ